MAISMFFPIVAARVPRVRELVQHLLCLRKRFGCAQRWLPAAWQRWLKKSEGGEEAAVRNMFAFSLAQAVALASVGIAGPAWAGVQAFDTSSGSVRYAVNDGGFWVRTAPIAGSGGSPGLNATSAIVGSAFHLTASGSSYSDAGIVLYFDGTLKLGDLQGVSITSTGSPVSMNLWLDSGGDGRFFAFDSNGLLTGLNGDSYGGHAGNTQDVSSPFYMLGGNGAGSTYTLSQLQAGAVSSIGATTPVALWIGITNGGGSALSADIGTVTVSTVAAQPVPAVPWPLSGLAGVLMCLLGVLQLRASDARGSCAPHHRSRPCGLPGPTCADEGSR
jgi:hypothetical protein